MNTEVVVELTQLCLSLLEAQGITAKDILLELAQKTHTAYHDYTGVPIDPFLLA